MKEPRDNMESPDLKSASSKGLVFSPRALPDSTILLWPASDEDHRSLQPGESRDVKFSIGSNRSFLFGTMWDEEGEPPVDHSMTLYGGVTIESQGRARSTTMEERKMNLLVIRFGSQVYKIQASDETTRRVDERTRPNPK